VSTQLLLIAGMSKSEKYVGDMLTASAKPRVMTVVYEDIADDLQADATQFLTFLGVPQRRLISAEQRLHAGRIDDVREAMRLLLP
jgi:hypothetical protein